MSRLEARKYGNHSRSSVIRPCSVAFDTAAYNIQCYGDCANASRKYQKHLMRVWVNWVLLQTRCGVNISNVIKDNRFTKLGPDTYRENTH